MAPVALLLQTAGNKDISIASAKRVQAHAAEPILAGMQDFDFI